MKLTDENKVSIVAVASLVFIYFVLKNVFHAQDISGLIFADTISYWLLGFFSHANREEVKNLKWRNPLYWRILIIVLITLATIAVYAI